MRFIENKGMKKQKTMVQNWKYFSQWQPKDPERDPRMIEDTNSARRKRLQTENSREYDEAIVNLQNKVREMEGQDMRETIQDKVTYIRGSAMMDVVWQ